MIAPAASCQNKCVFCFIDQLPAGLRKTLYFKDDDSRLSFLTGNYVTLTNIDGANLDRIINYRMSPINVSVHATDPDIRIKLLNNKKAGDITEKIVKITKSGIEVNCQIVLVKGINDGNVLNKSVTDLIEIKGVNSVSVVPCGITKYRDNLPEIDVYGKDECEEIINAVENMQKKAVKQKGCKFVYIADEIYIKAERELPDYNEYDGFPQLENGVGMIALFKKQFDAALSARQENLNNRKVTVITGESAYRFMAKLCERIAKKFTTAEVSVIMVRNVFLGDNITVSGLLSGADIMCALKANNVSGTVLFPENCFKADEDILIDDVTLEDINKECGVNGVKVKTDGGEFLRAVVHAVKTL
jgi:putative radical SAM enzyme (TIGR03279 family)